MGHNAIQSTKQSFPPGELILEYLQDPPVGWQPHLSQQSLVELLYKDEPENWHWAERNKTNWKAAVCPGGHKGDGELILKKSLPKRRRRKTETH